MTAIRSEDVLVGLVALAVIPWIGWTVLRGLRDGRLPIGRAYVRREERPGAYRVLLSFWMLMTVIAAVIMLDLLFKIEMRFWL